MAPMRAAKRDFLRFGAHVPEARRAPVLENHPSRLPLDAI